MIIEKCPICNNKLEAITTKDGYVSDWFCNRCSLYWTLEELEFKPEQKTLEGFL